MNEAIYLGASSSQPLPFKQHKLPANNHHLSKNAHLSIIALPNDVLLVNIKAPDHHGVSYNTLETLDINVRGIILNNAFLSGPSKLAKGEAQGNSQLAVSGPCKTIVLHVVGSLPSHLEGCLEVLGSKAEVIIANCHNITCQGITFLNVSRLLLTTGLPFFGSQRQLESYHVTQGEIRLIPSILSQPSDALNWENLNQVDLLARSVQLDTRLYAQAINVITGHYEIPHTSLDEPLLPYQELLDEKSLLLLSPHKAIEITHRGGIDAKAIELIGNENNVRIEIEGGLQAKQLGIKTEGLLMLSGMIRTQNMADIKVKGSITHTGRIDSKDNVQLKSKKQITHSGCIHAKNLHLISSILKLDGQLQTNYHLLLKGEQIYIQDQLSVGCLLEVQARKRLMATGNWRVGMPEEDVLGEIIIESEGAIQLSDMYKAYGSIYLQGSQLNLSESTFFASDRLSLKATEESIYLNKAKVKGKYMSIETPLTLYNLEGYIAGGQLKLHSSVLMNEMGHLCFDDSIFMYFSDRPDVPRLTLEVDTAWLENSGGFIQAQNDIVLDQPTIVLDNKKGNLHASGLLVLRVAQLHNQEGEIKAKELMLSVPSLKSKGLLKAEETLILNIEEDYHHTKEDELPSTHLFINTNAFFNHSNFKSAQTIQIEARKFYNDRAALVESNTVQLYLAEKVENKGRIDGAHIHCNTNILENTAELIYGSGVGRTIQQDTGIINAKKTIYIGAKQLKNAIGGLLSSQGVISIGGHITSSGEITKDARLVESYGVIYAQHGFTIHSHQFSNYSNDLFMHGPLPVLTTPYDQLIFLKDPTVTRPHVLTQFDWQVPLKPINEQTFAAGVDDCFLKQSSSFAGKPLSSDYLLGDKLKLTDLPKRLGDGRWEQQQVQAQIAELGYQEGVSKYKNDEVLFKALMDAAHSQSENLGLTVGVPLTLGQIGALTQDIIWMVEKTFMKDEGNTYKRLVPQVYLTLSAASIRMQGGFVAAKQVNLKVKTLYNSDSGIFNLGETVITTDKMISGNYFNRGNFRLISEGELRLEAPRIHSQGGVSIQAKHIHIDSMPSSVKTDHSAVDTQSARIGTEIYTRNDLELKADTVTVKGGQLGAHGRLKVQAEESIEFKPDQQTTKTHTQTHHTKDRMFSCTTFDTEEHASTETTSGATVFGKEVHMQTEGNLKGEGLRLVATDKVQVEAKGRISLEAAANTLEVQHNESIETSGVTFDTEVSFGTTTCKTEGSQKQIHHQPGEIYTQGSVVIEAGDDLSIKGCALKADSAKLAGDHIAIEAVMDTKDSHLSQNESKSGLSIGVAGGLASVYGPSIQDVKGAKDSESNTLAAIQATRAAYTVGSSFFSSDPRRNEGISYKDMMTHAAESNLKGMVQASGLNAQTSLGISEKTQNMHEEIREAQSSSLHANTIEVEARQDLKVSGSELKGEAVSLKADGDVIIQQAENTTNVKQDTTHYQAKVGVSVGAQGTQGFFETQTNKQKASQSSIKGHASTVQAGNTLTIQSKGDTQITGAKVGGSKVIADVAGDLTLKSTQDTTKESHESYSAHLRVGVPIGATGKVSAYGSIQAKQMESEACNVKEQTTLQAGEGGFEIAAKNTHLVGAGVQSQASIEHNTLTSDTLDHQEIENKAHYKKREGGLQMAKGPNIKDTLVRNVTSNTSALTNQSKSKTGVTESSLSEAKLTLPSKEKATLPATQLAHQPIEAFDTQKMAEKAAITQQMSQLGMQISGDLVDFAETKLEDTDPNKYKKLEGFRMALHAGTAGASALLGEGSATGAIAGTVAGNLATLSLDDTKNLPGLGQEMSELARNTLAGVAGAAAGALAGAIFDDTKEGACRGASQALIADAWNRQLHHKEAKTLKDCAKGKSPEEVERLKEAAAYLTRASKGVPAGDPKKRNLKEMEARGKNNAEELDILRDTDLFNYTQEDAFFDWLLENDKAAQKIKSGAQIKGGFFGATGGFSLLRLGMKVHPGFWIPGLALEGYSLYSLYQGAQGIIEDYESKEGQRVLDALDLHTYPGESNRPLELAYEVGGAVAPWAATKAVKRGVKFFCEPYLKRVIKGERVTANRVRGKAAEKTFIDQGKAAGRNIEEMTEGVNTELGWRFFDAVELDAKGNPIRYFEIKTGNSPYTASQMAKDALIAPETPVELIRIPNEGLLPLLPKEKLIKFFIK